MARAVKVRTFSLRGSSGIIEEEAQIVTPEYRPTIQLLKFTKGEAAGSYAIRFCQLGAKKALMRAPMVIDASAVRDLKKALVGAPKLRKLLGQFG